MKNLQVSFLHILLINHVIVFYLQMFRIGSRKIEDWHKDFQRLLSNTLDKASGKSRIMYDILEKLLQLNWGH